MKTSPFLFAVGTWLGTLACLQSPAQAQKIELEEVVTFPTQQVTGVAVSKTGRLFINFPDWSDNHSVSVLEVLKDGSTQPYPNEKWNQKEGPPDKRFICVQSVYVDDEDTLWILDPASPKMAGIVPSGPKLLRVDLEKNQVVKTFTFDESIAPSKSYLNDIRVDTTHGHAFITDSGTGAIIALNLKNGEARRLLADHPSTKAEEGIDLIVDGIKVIDPQAGKAPQIHADGIALDKEGGWLYYHALTSHTLYRVKTADLADLKLSAEELAKKVENVATTPAPDGMLEASNGSLYLTALETNAIIHYDPRTKTTATIIEDPRLQWPDTLAMAADGHLYVTTSQIHRMPKYHNGTSQQKGPFAVYRLKLNPPTQEVDAKKQNPADAKDTPVPTSTGL
jgi:sugar lactone lactonase YvrE